MLSTFKYINFFIHNNSYQIMQKRVLGLLFLVGCFIVLNAHPQETFSASVFNNASWIGPDIAQGEGWPVNSYAAFRKQFVLKNSPTSSLIHITADSRYQLWVNGIFIGRGPARCFSQHQSYDTYDIVKHLQLGANWIAVLVHHYGVANALAPQNKYLGLLMEGEVFTSANERLQIQTDSSWGMSCAKWFLGQGNTKNKNYITRKFIFSGSYGFQEWFDSRLEPLDWRTGHGQKDWNNAISLAKANSKHWSGYEPRGLKPMLETILPVEGPVATFTGVNAKNFLTTNNLGSLWQQEKMQPLSTVPIVDSDGWITVTPPSGGFVALSFDLGWNAPSFPKISVRGGKSGEIFDSAYSTIALMDKNGKPQFDQNANDRFIAKSGIDEWQAYSLRGYKYHTVKIRANHSVTFKISALGSWHDAGEVQSFECSDPGLTKAWTISDRTLRAGMLDAFVDNNWREQAQWVHDGCDAALGAWATYGDTKLWRRLLRQTGQSSETFSNGAVDSIVTGGKFKRHIMPLCDYTAVWLTSLEQYIEITGDFALLHEMKPYIRDLVMKFLESGFTPEHLFAYPPESLAFLDWSKPRWDKRPYNLTLNLMVLRGIRSAERMARWLDDKELKEYCRILDHEMTSAVCSRFWSPELQGWREHCDPSKIVMESVINKRAQTWLKDPFNNYVNSPEDATVCTRHGNSLAVLLHLGSPEQQAGAAALVSQAFNPNNKKISNSMSPLWTDKIFGALFEGGRDADAIRLLQESYGTWAENGAIHWGESFAPSTASQTCGASLNWLLTSYVLGIRPVKAGFAEAVFDPRPGNLQWAKGIVKTPHGTIHVSWKRGTDGKLTGSIQAPKNIRINNTIRLQLFPMDYPVR